AKRDHCNKTVDIYEDVSSPEVTPENIGKPMTCWYRFRSFRGTPRDWILRIRFKKFKVGTLVNATHCHMGYMQIVDGNAKTDVSNRKDPGFFCGETEQPQTFISETSFVKVLFHTDNFTDQTYFSFDSRAEQQFEVYLRYGQHPELYPNRRGEVVSGSYCERVFRDCRLQTCYVQSPAYPGVYPRGLHCRYHLNTRLPFIKLYIENEEFNIDGQRCENIMTCPMRPISSGEKHCPYDYIKIYDGINEGSPVIGTFCGMGKFPYSIIGTSEDLFVEFLSSLAGPLLNTGFHFNVGNWPGHVETAGSRNGTCDWVLTSEDLAASGDSEGIFLSVAHWYPPHTSCTYLMQGQKDEIVRLYFPSFRINRIESPIQIFDGDCGESLTLYDASWPDDSRIIKTFCDTFSRAMEKHDFVSTGNALFVRFESKTGSYSGSSLYYWAHYDFFNNSRYGEKIPDSACDEVFSSWHSPSGWFRSPLNTLVYKRSDPTEDVRCLYRFVTDKRLFARVILTVEAISFKDYPYNAVPCDDCWEDRVDKLLIWESPQTGSNNTSTSSTRVCLCKRASGAQSFPTLPVTVVSKGESLNLQLHVDAAHAASSYFKHPTPLFEARYEFVHGPLCGPPLIPPTAEGELHFPFFEALGYVEPPKTIRCIWELRVTRQLDLWLHIDKIKFASRTCEDGRLEFFLPSKPNEPFLSVCGENVSSLKQLPILSATELSMLPPPQTGATPTILPAAADAEAPSVKIQFTSSVSPTRTAFKIAWTEMYHLPRNPDGTMMTSRLTESSSSSGSSDSAGRCEFECPGDSGLCIPTRLVCNGVVNCPNVTLDTVEESGVTGSDESPELCERAEADAVNWLAIGLGAAAGAVLAITCLVVLCRACLCHKRAGDHDDDIDIPY
ncbi:Dorsal-ventral patterning protein tolloid, partial [Zootermopsis nevadensis]